MSFRLKIVLSVVLLSFLVMIGVLWQSLVFLEQRLHQQMVDANQTIIRQLRQHSAIEALVTDSFGQLQFELQQLVVDSSFDVLVVADYQEQIMASSDPTLIGKNLLDLTGQPAWIIDSIEGGGVEIGQVAYRFNNQKANSITDEALRFGLILAITGFIFVASVGYVIGTFFSRRIEKIASSLDAISSGNLEQFEVDETNDEIGRLSRFVYDMGKKVSTQMSELMDVEERMRIALQAAGAGAWKWDSVSDSLQWSAKNFQILGYLPAEHKPSYELWLSSVHSDDLEKVKEAVRHMWKTKTDIDVEYRILRRHGETRWMRSVGRMFLDQNEKPTEIYGLQIDITDYKKLTNDVENQKLLFEAMLNQAEEGIIAVDINQRVITANAAAFSFLGYSHQELIGQEIIAIMAEPDAKIVSEFIRRDVSETTTTARSVLRECNLIRKNADMLCVRMTIEKFLGTDLHNQYLFTFKAI